VEVVVVEARALAQPAVPRLQRLGGSGILDDFLHARADHIHDPIVGDLGQELALFGARLAPQDLRGFL
jgi:hypothetical protein